MVVAVAVAVVVVVVVVAAARGVLNIGRFGYIYRLNKYYLSITNILFVTRTFMICITHENFKSFYMFTKMPISREPVEQNHFLFV